jgi:hypothetical protein
LLLIPVKHFNDVVTELRVQWASWLQHRAGKHHFIERWNHLALTEFTQMAAFFTGWAGRVFLRQLLEAPFLICSRRSKASFSSLTRICSAAAVFAMIVP